MRRQVEVMLVRTTMQAKILDDQHIEHNVYDNNGEHGVVHQTQAAIQHSNQRCKDVLGRSG